MKKVIIRFVLYLITISWIIGGFFIDRTISAEIQRTYTGMWNLIIFDGFWYFLLALLVLIRSRMSVSMPVKTVMISSGVCLVVSAVGLIYGFFNSPYIYSLYMLVMLPVAADLFDMVCAAVRKNRT